MTPELMICDCDGVLVDSEPISVEVLRGIVADAGGAIGEEVIYERLLGRSLATTVEVLRDDYGLTLTDADLAEMRARLHARFRAGLQPVKGVAAALRACPWPRCVASSSQPERIRLSLEVTGLLGLFEPNIFSATMVKQGKPHPDLFLHAAGAMGVDPAGCVVIEDSAAGIRAARAAGMRVIAFTGASHAAPARLHETVMRLCPDAVVDAMDDLHQAVTALD